jgi:hypothetical protein
MMQIWPPQDGTSASFFWGTRDVLPTYKQEPQPKGGYIPVKISMHIKAIIICFQDGTIKNAIITNDPLPIVTLKTHSFILYLQAWGRWGSNTSLA